MMKSMNKKGFGLEIVAILLAFIILAVFSRKRCPERMQQ